MNKLSLFPLLLVLFFSAKSQDKIICINHDTINCTILSISNERILYEQKKSDGLITGKFIPLSQVAEYVSNHQLENEKELVEAKTTKIRHKLEKPFCFGVEAGKSNMPWYLDNYPSSNSEPDYYDKLKTGFHINANAHYMIRSFLGFGAEYSFFKTSTSGSIPILYSTSIYLAAKEKYRMYINYLGASVLFQQYLGAKRRFIIGESLSAGVLLVRMESQYTLPNISESDYTDISYNSLVTGETFSGKLGITAEYRLFEAVSIGLGSGFSWGKLKKADIKVKGQDDYSYSKKNEELSNAMKLSRIEYSFILRYYF
jgi:hypothetical protein